MKKEKEKEETKRMPDTVTDANDQNVAVTEIVDAKEAHDEKDAEADPDKDDEAANAEEGVEAKQNAAAETDEDKEAEGEMAAGPAEPEIGDERVRSLVAAVLEGGWKPEMETMIAKAFDYDHDVEQARAAGREEGEAKGREEGEAKGREEGRLEAMNERIEEYMARSADGDGVPHPGSGQPASAPHSIFDLARGAR